MLAGSAMMPRIATSQMAELVASAQMPRTAHTTVPLISHFSCWRRSPEDRRQLAA